MQLKTITTNINNSLYADTVNFRTVSAVSRELVYFFNNDPSNLTENKINAYIAFLKSKNKPATINQKIL